VKGGGRGAHTTKAGSSKSGSRENKFFSDTQEGRQQNNQGPLQKINFFTKNENFKQKKLISKNHSENKIFAKKRQK
jgi:hypothetical protein